MECTMIVLGIETTCDETGAAVVERPPQGPGRILANVVLSQIEAHAAFGGVVPEIAARAHVEALDLIIAKAMGEAGKTFAELDGVAAAGGPQVEREALTGNPARFSLPRPMLGRPHADFSLSGLKTALRVEADKIAPLSEADVRDLCASFQQSVVEVVADRLRAGLKMFR